MKDLEENLFSIIQKIMDETIENRFLQKYDYFEKLENISNKLIEVLDDGYYIDNAKVIRNLDSLIAKYEIFNVIPNLANKHIISVQSNQQSFYNFINKTFGEYLNCKISINIPYIILPYCESVSTNSVYVLSYCNKLVELTMDEYKLICTELDKYNIDIGKLIKCFFSYQSKSIANTCFVYLPLDMDIENTVYRQLRDKITVNLFIGVNRFNKKIFNRKLFNSSFYFIGSREEYNSFINEYKLQYIKYISYMDFMDRIKSFDNIYYNCNINEEIDLILLEIKSFYINSIDKVSNILKGLKNDLLRIQNDKLKGQLQSYYVSKQKEYDELIIGKTKFCNFYSEIINNILNISLSNEYYDNTLLNLENQSEVLNVLIKKFFIYSNVNDIEGMQNIILQLKKSNFNYIDIFEIYLRYLNKIDLSKAELYLIKNVENVSFNCKIKIAMSDFLDLSE